MNSKKVMKWLLITAGVFVGILSIATLISNIKTKSEQTKVAKQNNIEYISEQLSNAETVEDINRLKEEALGEFFTEKYENELDSEQKKWLRDKLMKVNRSSENLYIDFLGEYQYNLVKVWDYELHDYVDGYVDAGLEILSNDDYAHTTLKFHDLEGSVLEMYKHEDGYIYANVMLKGTDKSAFEAKYSNKGINVVKPAKVISAKFDDVIETLKESNTLYYGIINSLELNAIKASTEVNPKEFYFVEDNSENESILEDGFEEVTWAAFTLGPREIQIIKHIYANVDSKIEELEFIRFLYERDATSFDIVGDAETALHVYGAELH